MDLSQNILCEVNGASKIVITDHNVQKLGSSTNYVKYYNGAVKFGPRFELQTKAFVLAFTSSNGEEAESLYMRLVAFDSPFVLKPLSYGRGVRRYRTHTFLAVTPASLLLSNYIDVMNDKTTNMKRFSEDFIKIIGDIVQGIITLHSQGYYCAGLHGRHVLIYTNKMYTAAKIWNFRSVGESDKKKSRDWVDLGKLLEGAALINDTYTTEIKDLCEKLKGRTLSGKKILKHSGLLTVREKFENIMALNLFVLVHKNIHPQIPSGNSERDRIITELVSFLDTDINWVNKTPPWITARSNYQKPRSRTGFCFIDTLRDIFEHENEYIPEKVKQSWSELQKVGKDPDLEYQLRIAWHESLLKAQNFVLELDIQY